MSAPAQVSSVCRSAFYQLRQLRPVVRSLTTDAAKMVIQAFVSLRRRLDYTATHVLRHLRRLDTTTTSGSEHCGASRHRYAEAPCTEMTPPGCAYLGDPPPLLLSTLSGTTFTRSVARLNIICRDCNSLTVD